MIALVACVLLLGLNAFFVAAEFALVKVRITQLDRAVARGDRRAIAAVEDPVEQFVGEIRDELDDERDAIVRLAGDSEAWDVDANAPIDDLVDLGLPVTERGWGSRSGPSSRRSWVTCPMSATASPSRTTSSPRWWRRVTGGSAGSAYA